ncbi:MAG TPA: helix-turn-helix domain-containing protein [Actinomycetota bacterium]|nr:helix-turn-helix domain-containing protein [Actinomycetota bacterium]
MGHEGRERRDAARAGFEGDVGMLGVLAEDVRRRLYLFVRASAEPVTRERAAAAVGISRKLAAFHLDKLVERGLLAFDYGRPSGRGGPGAGRTSKMYRPAEVEIEVSIPERRYDLAGALLVKAIRKEAPGETAWDAAVRVAGREGAAVGEAVGSATRAAPREPAEALRATERILARYGYEPVRRGSDVVLRNCPFHALAREAPDLVCGMNRSFIDGLARGLGAGGIEVALEPEPGLCCVKLRPPAASSSL